MVGEHQLIPEFDKVVEDDEVADVVLGALRENLFVHQCPIPAVR
jgi:hypothetical protein